MAIEMAKSNQDFKITHLIIRLLTVSLSSFFAFKGFVAIISDEIPAQPFYGYKYTNWMAWIIDWRELLVILLVTIFFFGLGHFILRKLSNILLAFWGGFLGIYIALVSYDFVVTKIESVMEYIIPFGKNKFADTVLGLLGIVFILLIPLLLAWMLAAISRRK